MKTGRMPHLTLPPQVINQDQAPLHQHRRLVMLRRALNDDSLPWRIRFAAAFVLLYAQSVTRIVGLTLEDVTDDGTTVTVRLGDPPAPLPEPVADLMRSYLASHQHLTYASSRSCRWLFPGRQPGRPMNLPTCKTTSAKWASHRSAEGPLRSGTLSSGPRHPSSQRPSATTTRPPPAWSLKLAEPGADTPR